MKTYKCLIDVYGASYSLELEPGNPVVVGKDKDTTIVLTRVSKKPELDKIGEGFVSITNPFKTISQICTIAKLKPSEHRIKIGQQIMKIRESKGITQMQLAEMTGYGQSNICKIERGRYNASIDIIQKVCDALGARIEVVE